jgi:PIN domain nuclease of toxin-antitoxin system
MADNRYLLDTHCLIWFQENNPKIPEQVMTQIQKANNIILFSQVSLFEISIKQKIGKLSTFNITVEDIYLQAIKDNFTFLPLQNQHIFNYYKIPLLEDHRDPFDRLLLATALEEDAIIISADEKFNKYERLVKILW